MGYPAKKGMYRDENSVYRFQQPGTPKGLPNKRWFRAEVVRRAIDSKGETKRRNKQVTSLFTTESEVVALAMRHCPSPDMGDGDIRTNVYFRPLGEEENL